MSMADEIFIRTCKDILENGSSTEGERYVRIGRTAPLPIR